MSKYLRIIISITILTIVIFIAAFVWPTMYRYDRFYKTVVRTNRFTGNAEMLTTEGWDKMQSSPKRVTVPEDKTPAVNAPPSGNYLTPEQVKELGLEDK